MSRDLTPDRLDALFDGREAPASDEEREMLLLAAEMREAAPRAGAPLRDRVRGLGEPAPEGRVRRLARYGGRRWLVAAPALSALVAAIIAVGVLWSGQGTDVTAQRDAIELTRDGSTPASGDAGTAPAPELGDQAAPVAPSAGAARSSTATAPEVQRVIHVAAGSLDDRLAHAREIVRDAGGSLVAEPSTGGPPAVTLTITVPPERAARMVGALDALGRPEAPSNPQAAEAPAASTGVLIVVITEAP